MSIQKTLNSKAEVVIAGGDQSNMFPIGFEYSIEGMTYKVVGKYVSDNAEIRKLAVSDGSVENVLVESIIKDFRQNISKVDIVNNPQEEKKQTQSKENSQEDEEKQ